MVKVTFKRSICFYTYTKIFISGWKNFDDKSSRLDTTPRGDGQTDRQTDRHCAATIIALSCG